MNISKIYKDYQKATTRKHRMKRANEHIPSSPFTPLTSAEKHSISSIWNPYLSKGLLSKTYMKCFPFYKSFREDFDQLIPSDFYSTATTKLNTSWGMGFLSHKANLHYFIPEVNRPITIIYDVNGHRYDSNNNSINKEQASSLLSSKDEFVYKKAIYTGSGRDVMKYENASRSQIDNILNSTNYIIQEVVLQHPFMSNFNSSSVNTIRMETLNLNDTCSVLSAFIRIGAKGSFVDNISGREGMVVGVDDNGNLCDFGLNKDYEKVFVSSSGMKFKGLTIPNYSVIKDMIKNFHKSFPVANIINWDVAIAEDGTIKIIEINLDSMNPLYHQIFNGSIFKERSKEVIDYVTNMLNQ